MTPLDSMLALYEVGIATCAAVFALVCILMAIRRRRKATETR